MIIITTTITLPITMNLRFVWPLATQQDHLPSTTVRWSAGLSAGGRANFPLQCCELPLLGKFCCTLEDQLVVGGPWGWPQKLALGMKPSNSRQNKLQPHCSFQCFSKMILRISGTMWIHVAHVVPDLLVEWLSKAAPEMIDLVEVSHRMERPRQTAKILRGCPSRCQAMTGETRTFSPVGGPA